MNNILQVLLIARKEGLIDLTVSLTPIGPRLIRRGRTRAAKPMYAISSFHVTSNTTSVEVPSVIGE